MIAHANPTSAEEGAVSLQILLQLLSQIVVKVEANDAILDLALPMLADKLLPGTALPLMACASRQLAVVAAASAKANNRQAHLLSCSMPCFSFELLYQLLRLLNSFARCKWSPRGLAAR